MEAQAILTLIAAVVAAAPTIEEGVLKAKAFIEAMFTAKLISTAQQDALIAVVDARAKLAEAGLPPVHWTVQPDPS